MGAGIFHVGDTVFTQRHVSHGIDLVAVLNVTRVLLRLLKIRDVLHKLVCRHPIFFGVLREPAFDNKKVY